MSKTGKTLVEYNVRNGKYKTASGSITNLTWLTHVGLDPDIGEQSIFGDGEEVAVIESDRGYNITLGMTAPDDAFETAMGIQEEIASGMASVQRFSRPKFSLFFEVYFVGDDGVTKTKKVWVLGVTVSKPAIPYDQSTETINPVTAEYSGKIRGENLKAAGGATDYVDANTGNKKKVYRITSIPTTTGYATFGDAVPVPTVKAGT